MAGWGFYGRRDELVDRFLKEHRAYQRWQIDKVGISVQLTDDERAVLARNDIARQSLEDLTAGLG